MQIAEKQDGKMTSSGMGQQKLPSAGANRESLRENGQFWTPLWLAEVMAAWVTQNAPAVLFDPAVGPGTFFAAARNIGYRGNFAGFELHRTVINEGPVFGLGPHDFEQIKFTDFIHADCNESYQAIISNPPYIRHHRLDSNYKEMLKDIASEHLGFTIDGRAGVHLYFLIKCLHLLKPAGRLAFLLPADVCEGVSSNAVWNRICQQFRLEAVLTFSEAAAPFPQVDTNALVFMISRLPPEKTFKWLRVNKRNGTQILNRLSGVPEARGKDGGVLLESRGLSEGLNTGFSRPPRMIDLGGHPLTKFARVMRGIATGANEFFFLTREQLMAKKLNDRLFLRAVGRTRDCESDTLTKEDLKRLDIERRPTWLLSLKGINGELRSEPLANYIAEGENTGLPERALIKSRNPWYKMEQRLPPPLLFAYLGRRDCRFILNLSKAVPLTGFLCVYPHDSSKSAVKKLWRALNHPLTQKNLIYVGKSYGSGAIKVEPRQLEFLMIPQAVLDEFGLAAPQKFTQPLLLESPGKYGRKNQALRKQRSSNGSADR